MSTTTTAKADFDRVYEVKSSVRSGRDELLVVAPRHARNRAELDDRVRRVRVRIEDAGGPARTLRFAILDSDSLTWLELVESVVDHERVDEEIPELVATAFAFLFRRA